MEQQIDEEAVLKAIACVNANYLINCYAVEDFIFGHIKPNEDIPFMKYIEDLGFEPLYRYLGGRCLNGHAIQDYRLLELNFDDACFEIFKIKIEYIFDGAPIDNDYDLDEKDICRYKYGLYEYLKGLYGMFREIIATDVEPDLFTAVSDIIDRDEQRDYYLKITKFVRTIKLKKLRQGGCVDRYLKNLPFISPIILRLIKKKKGRYFLKNNDTESSDYKLALLSCLHFYSKNNAKLFELKILQWEERRADLGRA